MDLGFRLRGLRPAVKALKARAEAALASQLQAEVAALRRASEQAEQAGPQHGVVGYAELKAVYFPNWQDGVFSRRVAVPRGEAELPYKFFVKHLVGLTPIIENWL